MTASDGPVVEVAVAGDAIAALYRSSAERVLRIAYLLTGNLAVAEELMQEAFIRVWQRWGQIEAPDAAAAYLRATVVNLSRSFLRRRALELRHRLRRADATAEAEPADRMDVLRALARLPHRQRACVVLRYYDDMTEAATARALGISVGAVKSQTHKALRRLERLMGEDPRAT